jgi:hypothetical protein
MNYLVYVGPCVICHEDTMIPENFTTGICDACTPHVCVPELPEDDYCDLCGHTFLTTI